MVKIRALIIFSESLKPKQPGNIRADALIDKVILLFLFKVFGLCPFITTCSPYYLDCFISTKSATTVLYFSFNTSAKRALNLGSVIL